MARFRTVLAAVARAANRGSKSLWQVSGNNMLYAAITLMFMSDAIAMGFLLVLNAIVLFLPSSSNPLTVAPRERLKLWPLTAWERYALRLVSPLLNPLTWLMLAGMVWKRITWGLWAFVASFFLAGFIGSSLRIPRLGLPRIRLSGLAQIVHKDVRQFLTALDLYCALLLAGPALNFRLTGQLPASARVPLTGLVLIIMSTMALTLFGLDGESGMMRYRMWPLAMANPGRERCRVSTAPDTGDAAVIADGRPRRRIDFTGGGAMGGSEASDAAIALALSCQPPIRA
ncbi:MAG TPA: hypothetical protein VKS01_06925 [Bryobacteraceae bacterium]|nr:hypothetical protein [Bryobacteraceae bacterium]